MTHRASTEQLLSAWLESEAPAAVPDTLVEGVHRATAGVRPRPRWLARRVGHHLGGVGEQSPRRPGDRRWILAVTVGLTLVGGLLAYSAGGSRPDQTVVPPDQTAVPPDPTPDRWIVVAADARAGDRLDIALDRMQTEYGPGPWDLLLLADGVEPQRVFDAAEAGVERSCPAFSPDGHRFSYVERGADGGFDVVVTTLDGVGRPAEVEHRFETTGSPDNPASCAQWSLDSRSLAFTAPDTIGQLDLVVIDLQQGTSSFNPVPNTTTIGGFAWSPAHRTIAYVDLGMWLVPVDGDPPTLLLEQAGPEETIEWVSWAPDGSVVDVGLMLSEITPDPGGNGFTGSQIGSEIRRLRPDGTTEPIPDALRGLADRTVWSPDGSRIAYTSRDGIIVTDRAGAVTARSASLSEDDGRLRPLAWSPDSQQLLAIMAAGSGGSQLVLLSRDLQVLATLTPATRAFEYLERGGFSWAWRMLPP